MTEPTDAEIRGLAHEGNGVYQDYEAAVWEITDPSLIKFARAVLAKWGTPPAGTVPLTDEQWQRIADLTGGRILTQAVKDEIERVIGIKGGQHGAE